MLRGSYGVFYDETPGNDLPGTGSGPQNAFINNAISRDPRNPIDIGTLFKDPPVFDAENFNEILDMSDPIGYVSLITSKRRSPYLQNWTLSIQNMLPGQVSAGDGLRRFDGAGSSPNARSSIARFRNLARHPSSRSGVPGPISVSISRTPVRACPITMRFRSPSEKPAPI